MVVMHIETVGKRQRRAGLHVGGNVLVIDVRNVFVRQQHHHHVSSGHGFSHFRHVEASSSRLGPGCAILAQGDSHIHAGIAQVLRMGVTLGTITDDGYSLALDQRNVSVLVVINFHVCSFS